MIRVGVLRGGTGNQYSESLATGAYVIKHLPRDRYEVLDIFLDKDGMWHLSGMPLSNEKLKMRVDVVWNALHGFYGEDGKVQQQLETLGIPYTGAGPLSSAIAMNKNLMKGHLAKAGIKTPRGVYIENWGTGERDATVAEIVRNLSTQFSPPWIVEPISRGHGNGAMRAATRDELHAVLLQMFDLGIPVLVEEAVLGREVSVSSMSGFRGQPVYTFLPMQKGGGRMDRARSEAVQKLARTAHRELVLEPYSRIEAIVTPKGQIYVLRVETMPAFHDASNLHGALDSLGITFDEFSRHLISEAMRRR